MSFEPPVVIHTLGRFEILIDGIPLRFAHRAPQRVFQLLTSLIAAGDRAVGCGVLADQLWPESEALDAQGALTTTLHRLRRVLGNPRAVRTSSGHLSLDPTICAVDLWILEQTLRAPRDPAELCTALELYRGPFLGDDPSPWALATRARVTRLVARARTALETRGTSDQWQFMRSLLALTAVE